MPLHLRARLVPGDVRRRGERKLCRLGALLAGFLLSSCGDDDVAADSRDSGPRDSAAADAMRFPEGTTDAAGAMADSAADAGGGGASLEAGANLDADASLDARSDLIEAVELVERPENRLSVTLDVQTSDEATVTIEVTDEDGRSWTVEGGPGLVHALTLFGMHPGTSHTLVITARAGDGSTAVRELSYTSGSLPADFPTLSVTSLDPTRVSPGVTLFNVDRWVPNLTPSGGYIIVVDELGEVVWYSLRPERVNDVRRLSNGNFAYLAAAFLSPVGSRAVEIDLFGSVINEWTAIDIGTDTMHHDLLELPSGNFATLSTELRTVDGYVQGANVVSYDVVGDVAVEFDPNGNKLGEWSLFDILNPLDVNASFHNRFWNPRYPNTPNGTTKDWTHGNALVYDARDDTYVVSVRHLDWLVKMSRAHPPQLVWRLGPNGDFMLTSGEWHYHQHAHELVGDTNVLLFDNGNTRPGGPPYFSRAVEFELDFQAMTARQSWEWRDTAPFYSQFLGDVDLLPNGNVLVTDGGRVEDAQKSASDPTNLKFARIVEVTHTDPPDKVLEISVRDALAVGFAGYSIYRAERLPSLVP